MKNGIYHRNMDDMNVPGIELFEALVATAESRNLVEAGAKIGISQAALSVKLQKLEELSPLPLFSYEGKRKVLTHYGRELYRIAKENQVNLALNYEAINRQYGSAETLTLRVGGRRELLEGLSSALRFGGKVVFVSLPSGDAITSLRNNEIDIAISFTLPDSPEIMAKKVMESSAKFMVHKKLLSGARRSIKVINDRQFLQETRCIFYREDGHLLRDWAAHVGVPLDKLNPSAVADDWRTVSTLIHSGWGYGIVPSYIDSSHEDLVTFDLPTEVLPVYKFYALIHKHLRKIPAFKDVLQNLGSQY